jgi:hypothetical protein
LVDHNCFLSHHYPFLGEEYDLRLQTWGKQPNSCSCFILVRGRFVPTLEANSTSSPAVPGPLPHLVVLAMATLFYLVTTEFFDAKDGGAAADVKNHANR